MPNLDYDEAINTLRTSILFILNQKPKITEGERLKIIKEFYNMNSYEECSNLVELKDLIKEVERNHSIRIIREGNVLNMNEGHKEWYKDYRKDNRKFWFAYEKLLISKNFPRESRKSTDEYTDQILELLEDPKDQTRNWSTKGMVLGSVQSGKTANYVGLVNKAADAGFKLFIIFTGITNDLRTQTQERFDEGFIGSQSGSVIDGDPISTENYGVAQFRDITVLAPNSLTTKREDGDIKRNILETFPGNVMQRDDKKIIVVCKKSPSVYRNLVKWAGTTFQRDQETGKINFPLFIIDDEADLASINTKNKKREVSPTNANMRLFINLFSQSSYISYTATPYANLMIDTKAIHEGWFEKINKNLASKSDKEKDIPCIKSMGITDLGEDLFPKDFIVALPVPQNYIGFNKLFNYDFYDEEDENLIQSDQYIRIIEDHSDDEDGLLGWMPIKSHRKDYTHTPIYEGKEIIPPSLEKAIYSFLLISAVKLLRNLRGKHSSMMIHVAWKVNINDQVKKQVENFIEELETNLPTLNMQNKYWKELRLIWDNDINHYKHINKDNNPDEKDIKWEDIIDKIVLPRHESILDKIVTLQLFGNSDDRLNYEAEKEKGKVVIVLGGNRISRGLTLEGLCVSYLARYSSAKMADTITQMARWFGYRDGYEDVSRIYLTDELRLILSEISSLDYEVREQIDYLNKRSDLKPKDFPVLLRTMPNLIATSKLKMGSNDISHSIDFANYMGGVTIIDGKYNEHNKNLFNKFLESFNKQPDFSRSIRTKFENNENSFKNDLIWDNVNYKDIISFIKDFKYSEINLKFDTNALTQYIDKRALKTNEISKWLVVLKNVKKNKKNTEIEISKYKIGTTLRTRDKNNKNKTLKSFGQIFTNPDADCFLSEGDYLEVQEITKANGRIDINRKESLEIYSRNKSNEEIKGILFLYPIILNELDEITNYTIAIMVPDSKTHITGEYIKNKTIKEVEDVLGEDYESDEEQIDLDD